MSFTIGSLFDGSGGFPLSAYLCGGEPIWASEVEPYPIAVTKSRFPKMIHLGDVSKINGAKVKPNVGQRHSIPLRPVCNGGNSGGALWQRY